MNNTHIFFLNTVYSLYFYLIFNVFLWLIKELQKIGKLKVEIEFLKTSKQKS